MARRYSVTRTPYPTICHITTVSTPVIITVKSHVLIQNVHTGYHASPDIINHQQHTLGHPSTRTRHQAAINPYNTMGRLPSHHQYQQVGSVVPPPERGSMDPLMMAASESNESQLTDNRSFDIIRQASSAGNTEQNHQFAAEDFAG